MRSVALALTVIALASGCSREHPSASLDVTTAACITCHLADYQRTTNPVHPGNMPTSCQDCHTMKAWQPALGGGHPEQAFPIASGAHKLSCQSCHDPALGSSTGGQNTSCIGCHGGDHTQARMDPVHAGVPTYRFDATMPHFCLGCHKDGKAAKHPEQAFPIASGPHRGIACADCHDSSLGSNTGGMNANCTGCHTRPGADRNHSGVARYTWSDSNKAFCRTCHPDGRNN